jgi:uncharacterized membrane protein YeaQ/YmgE (transglycosylase-associated protein family)
MPTPNPKVIFLVTLTICACALIGVVTGMLCILYKVPDMNTTMSGWFTHVIDTIAGALIGMLINTRVQNGRSDPPIMQIQQPKGDSIPTHDEPAAPERVDTDASITK